MSTQKVNLAGEKKKANSYNGLPINHFTEI